MRAAPACQEMGHSTDYRVPLPRAEYRWYCVVGINPAYLCGQHYGYWHDHYLNNRTLRPKEIAQWDGTRRFFHWRTIWHPYMNRSIPNPPKDDGSGIRDPWKTR